MMLRRLTVYATVTRYPGDYEPVPLSEARRAVAIARRVRKEVKALMPKEALRKRRKKRRIDEARQLAGGKGVTRHDAAAKSTPPGTDTLVRSSSGGFYV